MNNNRTGQIIYTYNEESSSFIDVDKISLFLRYVGSDSVGYFSIDNNISIDASNCYDILNNSYNYVVFDDVDTDFTDTGYLLSSISDSGQDFPRVTYPIKFNSSLNKTYFIFFRCDSSSANVDIDVYIDNDLVDTVSTAAHTPGTWEWLAGTFMSPDSLSHNLGIEIKETGNKIDKIYISDSIVPPSGYGDSVDTDAYITSHILMYETDGGFNYVNRVYPIYDIKNSYTETYADGWYNYNTASINGSYVFDHYYYAVVLATSGSSSDRYITWELNDNTADPYDPYDPYDVFIDSLPSIYRTI